MAVIVLIGMMGSGKSTVGRVLAARLGLPFHDCDAVVEQRAGTTIAELFAESGEGAFRALESAVLADLIAGPPAVIAAGGGVVEREENRSALAGSTVVWLRAEPETLAARVGDGAGRPLLADGPAATLDALGERRDPLYGTVADLVVDVDRRSVDEVVATICAAVPAR